MALTLVKLDDCTLPEIASAIRAQTGREGLLLPGHMAKEIREISAAEKLFAADIPEYAKNAALELAEKVRQVRTEDSIVFIAMSDFHYPAEEDINFYEEETIQSTILANQAAKCLNYMLELDFVAHLGDLASGAASTTPEMLKAQIEGFASYFHDAAGSLPVFIAIGNHDAGIYGGETLPAAYLYQNFTARSAGENTVISGEAAGGYCYRDFPDKKLRVYLLNTSELLITEQEDTATSAAQRDWFASSLLELNTKDDAAQWSFLVLSHYPADYGETMPLSRLLKAYVEGSSISGHDFFGCNHAKLIAQFHGHVHNFKADKLSVYSAGHAVKFDAWRLCVPNGQVNRENYYTTVGNYTEIDFSEDTAYPKTPGTAKGTSFTVNVIVPSEQVIYSFCYGAGYDRTVGYGATVYCNIIKSLTNVSMGNSAASVELGSSFVAKLSPDEGYSLTSVTVTMGGVDVTAEVYSDGGISISEVTGDVHITAAATVVPTTNLGQIAEAYDSTDPYEEVGYKNNCRLSSTIPEVRDAAGIVTTGFIPYYPYKGEGVGSGLPKTIVIEGADWDDSNNNCLLYFYGPGKSVQQSPWIMGGSTAEAGMISTHFRLERSSNVLRLIPLAADANNQPEQAVQGVDWEALTHSATNSNIRYFRISLVGSGERLKINFEDTPQSS